MAVAEIFLDLGIAQGPGYTLRHPLAYAACLQVRGNVRRCRSAQMCGEVKACTYRSAKEKEDKCRQRKHSDEHMARRKRSNGWIEEEEEELRRAAAENDVDVRLRGGEPITVTIHLHWVQAASSLEWG